MTPTPLLSRCCQTRTGAMLSVTQPMRPRRARRETCCLSSGPQECSP
ncbi:rCG46955 [Rattus norvegicus]|uniref:RCG46955 n=1 Tax=Rattus norvegicus TaxID=10116 RepID=A6IX51_RAT|nr:rCG46955 [Rattus norvegicus]